MNKSFNIKDIIIVFTIFFFVTFILHMVHPIICGDMTSGLVDKIDNLESSRLSQDDVIHKVIETESFDLDYSLIPPMYSLKFKSGYRLPLRYSARHAGFDLAIYKILSEVVSPHYIHALWNSLFRGLQGVLFFLIVTFFTRDRESRYLIQLAFLFMPISLFSYYVFITETVLHTVLLLVVYLLIQGRDRFRLAMIMTGLALAARPNFLWMAMSFVPFFWARYRTRIKEGLIFVVLGFLPFFFLFSYSDFVGEVATVYRSLDPTELFLSFIKSILLPKAYLDAYLADGALPSLLDYILGLGLVILISLFLWSGRKRENIKKLCYGIIISLTIIWIGTRSEGNSVLYMFYLPPVFLLLVLELLKDKNKFFLRFFLFMICLQMLSVLLYYIPNGNKTILDYRLQEKVVLELSKRNWVKGIVTVGTTDIGKISYLSKGKISPTNLYLLQREMKSKSLPELLMAYGKSGVLIVPIFDDWSYWFLELGPVKKEKFLSEAGKFDIKIEEFITLESKPGRGYYLIKYHLHDSI